MSLSVSALVSRAARAGLTGLCLPFLRGLEEMAREARSLLSSSLFDTVPIDTQETQQPEPDEGEDDDRMSTDTPTGTGSQLDPVVIDDDERDDIPSLTPPLPPPPEEPPVGAGPVVPAVGEAAARLRDWREEMEEEEDQRLMDEIERGMAEIDLLGAARRERVARELPERVRESEERERKAAEERARVAQEERRKRVEKWLKLPSVPALNEEQEETLAREMERVSKAPRDQCIAKALSAEGGGLSDAKVTRADLETLAPGQWLNDEVINFYLALLADRSRRRNEAGLRPRCFFMNTFFYALLDNRGKYNFARVRKWTKDCRDLLTAYDRVVVPVHLGAHWCLAVVDLEHKRVEYFDSLGGRNQRCLEDLRFWLRDEAADKKLGMVDGMTFEEVYHAGGKDIPAQHNSVDCGVFMSRYAECLSRGAPFNFSQSDMKRARAVMTFEILTSRVLTGRHEFD